MTSRSEHPVSNERLLEIASNMLACVPFELGPMDLQDIRTAVLELYRLRKRPPAVTRTTRSVEEFGTDD